MWSSDGGPLTPTEVARELAMPLSTLLFRVRRLENRGHAERVLNPDDGRSYLLQLTPAGSGCSPSRARCSAPAPWRWRRGWVRIALPRSVRL